MVLVFAGWHDLESTAVRHPLGAAFGQEMDIELIGKHPPLACAPVLVVKADAPSALDALRILIFGHQVRAAPPPAQCVKPASERLG